MAFFGFSAGAAVVGAAFARGAMNSPHASPPLGFPAAAAAGFGGRGGRIAAAPVAAGAQV
jgi:hypothetical protein